MLNIARKHTLRILAGGALMLYATLSYAQYMWIDEKGMKQVSDRPPPNSVPAKNILKQPSSGSLNSSPAPAAAPAADAKPPQSLADREADYRKRAKDKADQDQKTAEAAKQAQFKRANCDTARSNKQQLDTGGRLGTVDKNGERTVMDDAQRAAEQARANRAVSENCQ